jgi:hypothetical protein
MGLANNEPRRKGNNRGKATISGPSCQDYGEQIPNGLGQQTMLNPTVGQDVTINLRNRLLNPFLPHVAIMWPFGVGHTYLPQ